MISDFANVVGIIGVIIILWAYGLLQADKLTVANFSFSAVNFIGSMMILFSLLYHWNLPSVIIEIAWLGISGFGILRTIRKKPGRVASK